MGIKQSGHFRELIFTNHALGRLKERQIPLIDAWYTWRRPDQTEKGKTPGSWKYTKSKDNQKIQVITKQNEKKEWLVISVWTKKPGTNKSIFEKKSFFAKLFS